jgi:hypothetical protein
MRWTNITSLIVSLAALAASGLVAYWASADLQEAKRLRAEAAAVTAQGQESLREAHRIQEQAAKALKHAFD